MELAMLVYVVDSLLGSCIGVLIASVLLLGFYYFMVIFATLAASTSEKSTDAYKLVTKPRKWMFILMVVSTILLVVLPSTNTAKYMVGAYFVQGVILSEQVGEVSNLAYKATVTQLNKWAETQPELKVLLEDIDNKTNPSQGETK
jgi:hypothetical protein